MEPDEAVLWGAVAEWLAGGRLWRAADATGRPRMRERRRQARPTLSAILRIEEEA